MKKREVKKSTAKKKKKSKLPFQHTVLHTCPQKKTVYEEVTHDDEENVEFEVYVIEAHNILKQEEGKRKCKPWTVLLGASQGVVHAVWTVWLETLSIITVQRAPPKRSANVAETLHL